MKRLSKHMKESLNKSLKEISTKKFIEENTSDIIRASPAKDGGTMRGTLRNKEDKK